ncbi:MAG: putative O-methyltransferase YrrM [Flavobacteriales bacterium]|jgi:predicted O-methyltransferase YrrM
MSWFEVVGYIKYLSKRKGRHGTHSPFVYELIEQVLDNKRQFYDFEVIEDIRDELLDDASVLEVTDFGAGSRKMKGPLRKKSSIARYSTKPSNQAQTLFRLVNWLQPKTILELGTSLGLTTLYLHKATPSANCITLEGCPETANEASKLFERLSAKIDLRVGPFEQTLPTALADLGNIDLAFIDGDHRGEATLKYFEQIYPSCSSKSCLVFDDIHWSPDMQDAWEKLVADERVFLSIDLFYFGLVFFDSERKKEHFVLKGM